MPKYLLYNPDSPDPKTIDGAFDTDRLNYPRLPPMERMLQLSEEDWANYLAWHPWVKIQNGKVFDSDPEARKANLARHQDTPWLRGHEDLGTMAEHHQVSHVFIRSGIERARGTPLPPMPMIPGIPYMNLPLPGSVVGHIPPPVAIDPKPPTGPAPPKEPPENKPTPVPDPLGEKPKE